MIILLNTNPILIMTNYLTTKLTRWLWQVITNIFVKCFIFHNIIKNEKLSDEVRIAQNEWPDQEGLVLKLKK